jgi:hypothetical protein
VARHSKPSDAPAVNLDSLMDALTNVVAVLILVLILLQADVGKAVERLLGNLAPATPEQVQQAKDEVAQLIKDRDAAKAMLSAKPPEPKQIEDAKTQLALLEKSFKDSDVRLLAVDQLKQLQLKHQAELDAEKKKTDLLLEEIRKLEALLDETPLPQAVKPDIVRIPNSRAIPEGANVYYAYVIGDRVHLVDPITAKEMVMDEFDKIRSKMLKQTIKVKGARDRRIYDQDKLVKHFAGLDLKVRGQKITVPYNRPWTRLAARIELDTKNGGVPLAAMEKPNSEWHRICNLIRSFPRGVLIFRVRPDGFTTYLKAREIADSFNMPSGWEVSGATSHSITLDGFEVNRLEEPKPPQDPKPAPTGPPPPKPGLD